MSALADIEAMMPPEQRPYVQKYIRREISKRDEMGRSIIGNVVDYNTRFMSQGGSPQDLDSIDNKLRTFIGTGGATQDQMINDYLEMKTGITGEE